MNELALLRGKNADLEEAAAHLAEITQTLGASEVRFRRLFEAAQDGVLILDAETGAVVAVNPFLYRLLGYSEAEIVGRKLWELGRPRDAQACRIVFRKLQQQKYVRYDDLPLQTKSGGAVAVEVVSNVYLAGQQTVIQCNVRDITERREMETALIHFRALVDSSSDAMMGKDPDGIITSWSMGAQKIFGYSADEMMGTSILRLIPEHLRDDERKLLEAIRRGESLDGLITVRRTKSGKLIDVSLTVCPIKDIDGKVIGASLVAHDVTLRKQQEREIERLSRLYAALSRISQATVTLHDRKELFESICRVLVEVGKLRMAWVGWLDVETLQIVPAGHYGDTTGYLANMKADAGGGPLGQGPLGIAIRGQQNYVCNDFAHDPHTLPWQDAAARAGFRSSASFLIRLDGVICGVISVYAGEVDYFQDKEIGLLEEAAAQISFALVNSMRGESRRLAEAELRWKTAFLEAQVDSTLDGILVVDDQGKRILQNRRVSEMWGIPPEISADPDDNVQVAFITQLTKDPLKFGARVVHLKSHPDEVGRDEIELLDGRSFDRYSSPVRDKAGQRYGRIWTFRDITEGRRTRASLLESQRFLRSTLDALSAHVAILDESGTIIAVNAAWERFATDNHFLDGDCGVGDNYVQVCDASSGDCSEEAPAAAKGIRAVIAGRDTSFTLEYPCDSPHERRWFTLRVTRFRGDGPIRVVVNHENITERKALEQQFRQAQKMEAVGQLASGVAHDFNNILAAIRMQADLLKSDGDLSADQSQLADDIGTAVLRAGALTRQLLAFSRNDVLQSRDLDLNHSVTETTSMLTRILGDQVTVKLKLDPQQMLVHADGGMMDQVLMNLAVNSRDAMPVGGQLVIETAGVEFDELTARQVTQGRPGAFVRLSVSDTGFGIPPENLSRIFEPFFTTKSVGKGTGLGLATVFGIAQRHGGWVNVYSELGHGTTFRVYLPRLAGSRQAPVRKVTPAIIHAGGGTVLVAEDETALRNTLRKSLTRLGYNVVEAPTGARALEIWKEQQGGIDLLLTDMMMPDGMTGKGLAELLLQDRPNLKVIYMSGYSAEIMAKDFPLEEGVNFLPKPFDLEKLAGILRHNLDRPA